MLSRSNSDLMLAWSVRSVKEALWGRLDAGKKRAPTCDLIPNVSEGRNPYLFGAADSVGSAVGICAWPAVSCCTLSASGAVFTRKIHCVSSRQSFDGETRKM